MIQAKKTKTRKQSIATLRRKADALLQKKYVPMYPSCLVCGKPTQVMHHWIYKSQSAYLRYTLTNLVELCNSCHAKHHLSGDVSVVATILKQRGDSWNDQLQWDRHILQKTNKGYLLGIIEDLQARVGRIEVEE